MSYGPNVDPETWLALHRHDLDAALARAERHRRAGETHDRTGWKRVRRAVVHPIVTLRPHRSERDCVTCDAA